MVHELRSKRLRLINSSSEILEKVIEGSNVLATHLRVNVPEGWTEFEVAPFVYVLDILKSNPGDAKWWNWLAILDPENILIGTCGYKGPPVDGIVEIGYGVISVYRGIGLATEIAAVLIDNAFYFPEVMRVIAHTLPEENASVKILRKCGFSYAGEDVDPDEGTVWKWELKHET